MVTPKILKTKNNDRNESDCFFNPGRECFKSTLKRQNIDIPKLMSYKVKHCDHERTKNHQNIFILWLDIYQNVLLIFNLKAYLGKKLTHDKSI